ncbi:MAG: septum formation initiator family protein [Pseudomonadota bacterium]
MIRSQEPLRLRQALIPLVCVIVLSYFAYHAVYGRHGFIAWLSLQNSVDTLEQQLAEVQATRRSLDQQVVLLRSESLDPDLLDERARATLGLAAPNEIVIFKDRNASGDKR